MLEENGNEKKEIVKGEEEASPKVFGVLRKRTGDGGRGGQNNGRSVYYSSPSGYVFKTPNTGRMRCLDSRTEVAG